MKAQIEGKSGTRTWLIRKAFKKIQLGKLSVGLLALLAEFAVQLQESSRQGILTMLIQVAVVMTMSHETGIICHPKLNGEIPEVGERET